MLDVTSPRAWQINFLTLNERVSVCLSVCLSVILIHLSMRQPWAEYDIEWPRSLANITDWPHIWM